MFQYFAKYHHRGLLRQKGTIMGCESVMLGSLHLSIISLKLSLSFTEFVQQIQICKPQCFIFISNLLLYSNLRGKGKKKERNFVLLIYLFKRLRKAVAKERNGFCYRSFDLLHISDLFFEAHLCFPDDPSARESFSGQPESGN